MDSVEFKSQRNIVLFSIENELENENCEPSNSSVNSNFFLNDESKALKVKEFALELQIDERKLMWRIDFFVLAAFCLLYLIANIEIRQTSFLDQYFCAILWCLSSSFWFCEEL